MNIVRKSPRTHRVAESRPLYSNTLTAEDGGLVTAQSNPDTAIVKTQHATANVEDREWDGVLDHRSVTFVVKATLKVKELRRRV